MQLSAQKETILHCGQIVFVQTEVRANESTLLTLQPRDLRSCRRCVPWMHPQVERNANALVVSTENITLNWYGGDNRSMLIPNTLFRMGCAAVVLTNRPAARRRAKYELRHITRVHLGADEAAYRCA